MFRTILSQVEAALRPRRRRRAPGRGRCVCTAVLVASLAALPAAAQLALSDQGIEFPDGSVQTTADPCATMDPGNEMIEVGSVCIDKYENSVWSEPTGGIQYGVSLDDYPCSDNGQDCFGLIYARSVPGVTPSRFITWFQAQQALAHSGKRLPTNAEWQMAVAGTPDSTDCNVSGSVSNTGVFGNCVSDWGAFDMVGNLMEWAADWGDDATGCSNWSSTYGDDLTCVGLGEGEPNSRHPGALLRGGDLNDDSGAGPFTVNFVNQPSTSFGFVGFRGAR